MGSPATWWTQRRYVISFALLLILVVCGGCTSVAPKADAGPDPMEAEDSPGRLGLVNLSQTTFVPLGAPLQFEVNGATLSDDPTDVAASVHGMQVPAAAIQLSGNTISLQFPLIEGRNDVLVAASDANDLALVANVSLWAGDNALTVGVTDEIGQPVSGAIVAAELSDDQRVTAEAESVNGQVVFENFPDRTIILTAATSDNRFGTTAVTGASGTVSIELHGFDEPSTVANNDFSLGTEGWDTDADGDGVHPVELIEHDEGALNSLAAQSLELEPSPRRHTVPQRPTMLSPQGTNIDLALNTSGEGPQSISRAFTVNPGTKNVTVRYRFITTEVPGGYFGTEYNDYFNVSIRSQLGGGSIAESNSMNGLGLGAFDASGATAWREVDLAIDEVGDTIQVDITVANVADDLLDSQVVVEIVKEKELAITQLALTDIDDNALQYLSTSEHTYFGGNTRIHGTITVEGAEDDELASLELEILEGGAVVARANLATAVRGTLITPFGEDEMVTVSDSQLLFELPSAQAGAVNQVTDGPVTLRVKAASQNGEVATKEFGAVEKLVRYSRDNRYGGRDIDRGGDDWVKPSVRTVAEYFDGITWGDFANMNGGSFVPDHQTHRSGNDIDGWYNGYNARDAATAQTMLDYLNDDTYGSRIVFVYVTYQKVDTNPFWQAIMDVTLDDGRQASDVIRPLAGHASHFHWHVADEVR